MKTKIILIGICILLFSLVNVSSETILSKPILTGDVNIDSKNYLDYKYDIHNLNKKDLNIIKIIEREKVVVIKFKDKDGSIRHLRTKKENIMKYET